MQKAFNFFRVFDLAFFVPGAVVLVGSYAAGTLDIGYWKRLSIQLPGGSVLLLQSVLAVLASFLLGLACHAVYRMIDYVFHVLNLNGIGGGSWYDYLDQNHPKHELTIYFWYLRATCWNTSIACVFVCLLMIFAGETFWILTSAAGIFLFLFLGFDFDRGMRRTTV